MDFIERQMDAEGIDRACARSSSATCSTHDRLFSRPGHFARLRRLLPDADWIALDGLGHVPMSDDPAQAVKAILEVTATDRPVAV